MKAVLAAACAVSMVVSGCRQGADANAPCNSDFSQSLTVETKLFAKCSPYTLPPELQFTGTLTVEAGVELRLSAPLVIGDAAAAKLIVKGSKEKPVRFTGGDVRLATQSAGSSLEQLVIERGALRIENGDVTVKSVRVPSASGTALELKMMGPLKSVKKLELGSDDPAQIIHASIAAMGALGSGEVALPGGSVITVTDRLEVDGAIHDLGAKIAVPESINVDGTRLNKAATLKIDPGVTIALGEKAAFLVGSERGPATLEINGTKLKPVTITGGAGLQFFQFAAAPKLQSVVIESAGSPARAAIYFENARGLGTITGSVFRHLPGGAVLVQAAKEPFSAFDNNTFDDVNGTALRMPLSLANGLGAGNIFTEKARVVVDGDVTNDVTLGPLGVPYMVLGPVKIDGNDKGSITLTVKPGASLVFDDNGKVLIGNTSPAKVSAKGTAEKPISFGKLKKSWFGFQVDKRGVLDLENVVISGIPPKIHPINFTSSDTSGSLKNVKLEDVRLGIHACADKVKIEGVSVPKGVKAVQSCAN